MRVLRMRHIGILAHSADGAALCFLEMVRESARRLGAHEHPEITLSALPMGPTLEAYARGDLERVRAQLARTAARLADAGLELRVPPERARGDRSGHLRGALSGVLLEESRARYVRIIGDLAREGCDAVALSCTEIPLLIPPEASPLPTLDSTRLLAHAAVAIALGHAPAPTWLGGPFALGGGRD